MLVSQASRIFPASEREKYVWLARLIYTMCGECRTSSKQIGSFRCSNNYKVCVSLYQFVIPVGLLPVHEEDYSRGDRKISSYFIYLLAYR